MYLVFDIMVVEIVINFDWVGVMIDGIVVVFDVIVLIIVDVLECCGIVVLGGMLVIGFDDLLLVL